VSEGAMTISEPATAMSNTFKLDPFTRPILLQVDARSHT
jgi:hypothetical protein